MIPIAIPEDNIITIRVKHIQILISIISPSLGFNIFFFWRNWMKKTRRLRGMIARENGIAPTLRDVLLENRV